MQYDNNIEGQRQTIVSVIDYSVPFIFGKLKMQE